MHSSAIENRKPLENRVGKLIAGEGNATAVAASGEISCCDNQARPLSVHDSALKRGYTEDDIRHALKHVHISYDVIDDEPPRTWVFGFTPQATLVELIVPARPGKTS